MLILGIVVMVIFAVFYKSQGNDAMSLINLAIAMCLCMAWLIKRERDR